MKVNTILFALAFVNLIGCKKESKPVEQQPTVFTAKGDINATINEFRNKLGLLNTTIGQTTGRREINWDAVPDSLLGVSFPANFFNPTTSGSPENRQRGLIYAGTSTAMVSKTTFAEINALSASEFSNFSGNKAFAVVNAALWPVEFRIAGQPTVAAVKGFGAVFSDVDKPNSTFIEFFAGDRSLGKYFVPMHDAVSSFSFLALYFDTDKITRVQVGHEGMLQDGEKDITQGGTKDLIILDDFIYREPIKL